MPTTYAIPNGRTVMDATIYSGNGAARSINNSDLGTTGFAPDLVWVKDRTTAGIWNVLFDSVRGAGNQLSSNQTDAELASASSVAGKVSAFNSDGFSVVTGSSSYYSVNQTGDSYVAWQWQAGQGTTTTNNVGSLSSQVSANTTSGFSVVTYTGNSVSGATVGHGLGATPAMMIVKSRNDTQFWIVQHQSLTGITWNLYLNQTDSQQNDAQFTAKSSTTVTLNGASVNTSGNNYVMYCWAPIAGYSAFGSYTGNGSSDGPFVYLGFRPKFFLWKRSSTSGNSWFIVDSSRNPSNTAGLYLQPDTSNAEGGGATMDLLSNGMKIQGDTSASTNASGSTYIYMAFAENPFKYANARQE